MIIAPLFRDLPVKDIGMDVMAHDVEHGPINVPAVGAPQVVIEVAKDTMDGWNVTLSTGNFTLTPQLANRAYVDIVGWTSTKGPPAIQGEQDGDAAIPPLLELVTKADKAGAKAIIIGCFDDTGLEAARDIATCPVIGIGQAAYHLASLYGSRFSVVTTLDVSVPILAKNISNYGLERNLGRVRASGVPVLALENDRDHATQQVKDEIRTALREDTIDSVVLGCAGMVHIVEDSADLAVKLIDGVHAAVHIARML